jgi:hypothetical protein
MTICPINRIVTPEHCGRLVTTDAHYHVIGNTGFPHVRDGAMPEIMEMKILDSSPPTRRVEARLHIPEAFTSKGKHEWDSKSLGNLSKHVH